MKQYFIIKNNQKHLLLFFAGWGMDEHPFLQYAPQDSDFMICYDYRTLDFDTSPLTGYTVIDVVAWSMGVWAASQVLSKVSLPIRRRIAINGTPFPIDEKRGIPPAIFMGTLEGLNEASLRKFQRRMCADGNVFARFQLTAPERSIEELKEELENNMYPVDLADLMEGFSQKQLVMVFSVKVIVFFLPLTSAQPGKEFPCLI